MCPCIDLILHSFLTDLKVMLAYDMVMDQITSFAKRQSRCFYTIYGKGPLCLSLYFQKSDASLILKDK